MGMRLRVEYEKGQELKYLSHLQMMRLVERVLRRADLPYALSEGFNPRIKLSLGTVLPVGIWGLREYFDLELTSHLESRHFMERAQAAAPMGFRIRRAMSVPFEVPSLQAQINTAVYCLVVGDEAGRAEVGEVIQSILEQRELVVRSRGKKPREKDLRPGIYQLHGSVLDGRLEITAVVASGSSQNVRPDELVDGLKSRGLSYEIIDIYRWGNLIKQGDGYRSPLNDEKVELCSGR